MTTVKQEGEVEVREIDLEELGRMVGVPIRVKPWWGSHRARKWVRGRNHEPVVSNYYREWRCPAIGYYTPTPPRVQGNTIIVYEGPCLKQWGKRHHKHRQWVVVLSVEPSAILIEVNQGTDACTHSDWFILGVDDRRPYVAEVGGVNTVQEAFDWLKPRLVLEAEEQGLEVKRQGDWFFIPIGKLPNLDHYEFEQVPHFRRDRHELYWPTWAPRPTRHYAEEIIHSQFAQHLVRGIIASPDHPDLVLEEWHQAVRNRAIRRDEHTHCD